MYLIDRNIALAALESIKNTVWGHDIPQPGIALNIGNCMKKCRIS